MWRAVNVFRGAHRLVPVLGRSTRAMPSLTLGWVRGDVRIRRGTQKLEKGEAVGRFVALVFIGYVLVYLCAPRPWTWWLWAACWFLACCVIAAARGDFADTSTGAADEPGPPDTTPENDQETAGEHLDTAAEPDYLRKAAYLRQVVEHQVAAAVRPGRDDALVHGKGARLEDLLTHIQADGSLPGWTPVQLGAVLEGIGVPVRPQMYFKVEGKKRNLPGVHVDDLTAALGRPPRLPAHLVPDNTPAQASAPGSANAPDEIPAVAAPTARTTTPAAVPGEGAS